MRPTACGGPSTCSCERASGDRDAPGRLVSEKRAWTVRGPLAACNIGARPPGSTRRVIRDAGSALEGTVMGTPLTLSRTIAVACVVLVAASCGGTVASGAPSTPATGAAESTAAASTAAA